MRMARPHLGRVATKHFRNAAQTQALDVLAQQATAFGGIVNEQRMHRTARQGFDAKRTGSGEEIKHARAFDRIVMRMHQNVEHAFAQPVRCGAHRLRRWCRQCAALKLSGNDAHGLATSARGPA